jgi:hypothetical protein
MKRTYLLGLALLSSGIVACTPPESCANGIDDDKNGLSDCADIEVCGESPACRENCSDGVDNNLNGDIDCADSNCTQDPICLPEIDCTDGNDNDQDGVIDCADADCDPATVVECRAEICTDGIDNNNNGTADCNDPGCAQAVNCLVPEVCNDGLDNDKDGFLDCFDTIDCAAAANCIGNQCNDGIDNDGDVLPDAADPGCQVVGATVEGDDNQCDDGIDNDFDGQIDTAEDPDCAALGHETNANQLPDLIMFEDDRCAVFPDPAQGCQPQIRTQNVSINDSEFQAGCFTGVGQRRIMEWDSIIVNIGNRPLVVGNTSDHIPIWTPVEAFGGSLEFFGWTRSFLRDTNDTLVAAGHKGSFCMIDLFEVIPGSQSIFNDCGNGQGINDGQGDVYSVGLPCQFIDITDVPAGNYTLEVQTDFTKQLPEKSYNNNSAFYEVILP